MELLAQIIVAFLMFVWAPYMAFCVLRGIWVIVNPFPFLKTLLPRRKPKQEKNSNPVVEYMYTVEEAMELMGIDLDTLKERIVDGKIKTYKEKGRLKVDRVDTLKLAAPENKRSKRSKRSYPVVSSFKEEYRINNPVEFTT